MTIILYTRRNVGMCALSYFVAAGHRVKVVTDDVSIKKLARNLGSPVVDQDTMGEYDLIVSVHWHKLIPEVYLVGRIGINFHPCLSLYRGTNPIKRYIENKNTTASVASHFMTNVFDDGEVICEEFFETGIVESYADFYNQALPYYFRVFAKTMKMIS